MTVKELIELLSKHSERRAVYFTLPDSHKCYEIDDSIFIFFSDKETDRNQTTNKTAPIILMGKESKQ